MFGFVTLVLVAFMLGDLWILKRLDKDQFHQRFHISQKNFYLFLCALILSFFTGEHHWVVLSLVVLAVMASVYTDQIIHWESQDAVPYKMSVLSSALRVVIYFLYGLIGFALSTRALFYFFPDLVSEFDELVLSGIATTAWIIFLVRRACETLSNQGFWINVGFDSSYRHILKTFIYPVILGLIFAGCSAYIVLVREVQPQTPLSEIIETIDSVGSLLVFIVLALFIAPLVEEIVFRGYFFKVIKILKGETYAIFFIALSFSFLHVGQYWGDWLAIFMVTVMGFTLTFLRAWSRTTLSSCVCHYTYNIGVVLIPAIYLALTMD